MTRFCRAFWSDCTGGPAAEFALVLPLLILFLFGIIDVGRLMWTWNQAEKATQMGVRFAVATDLIPSDLSSFSYAVDGGIPQGDLVPAASFPGVNCDSATCSCASGTCPFGMTRDSAAFGRLVAEIARYKTDVTAADVTVNYAYSGLGFAGDPNGPDVSPLITVNLRNLTFRPMILFGASIPLPGFSATLTMEDGVGTDLN